MEKLVQIVTTTETDQQARTLAHQLVQNRLAACVQITGPIFSVYPWGGTIEQSEEWRMTIKTLAKMFSAVQQHLQQHHPYEVPQIVALPIDDASPEYAQWVAQQIQGQESGE